MTIHFKRLGIMLLLSTGWLGCDLFLEIPPPGTIEPDQKMDMSYTPTCANASCTMVGLYRCRGASYEQCQDDPAVTCSLFKPVLDCGSRPSLDTITTQDGQNSRKTGSAFSILGEQLFVARGDTIFTFQKDNLAQPTNKSLTAQGELTNLLATSGGLFVSDAQGTIFQLDGVLAVTQTLEPNKAVSGSAQMIQGKQDTYLAHGDTVRAVGKNWAQSVDAATAPSAIAAGEEQGVEKVYVAFGNKLFKLDHITGKVEATANAPSNIIAMVAENGGVWVVYQKTLARYEGNDTMFEQPSSVDEDSLCGTASDMTLHNGALWITDISGCLSQYNLQGGSFNSKTIDLDNRPGAPATTNYRPNAPVFKQGLGYAVAKTTELVIFDPAAMTEVKRQSLYSGGTPFAGLALWEDALFATHDKGLSVQSEYCPCSAE